MIPIEISCSNYCSSLSFLFFPVWATYIHLFQSMHIEESDILSLFLFIELLCSSNTFYLEYLIDIVVAMLSLLRTIICATYIAMATHIVVSFFHAEYCTLLMHESCRHQTNSIHNHFVEPYGFDRELRRTSLVRGALFTYL